MPNDAGTNGSVSFELEDTSPLRGLPPRDAKGAREPLNSFLDNLWKKVVNNCHAHKLSFLYGPVMVITGDEEFREMLSADWT